MNEMFYMALRVKTGSRSIADTLTKPVCIVSETSDPLLWNELFRLVKSSY